MKLHRLAFILAFVANVSSSNANVGEPAERLSDSEGLSSIQHLDGWELVDEHDRVAGQLPGLISSREVTTDDKSRVVLMVFEKGEQSSEDIRKALLATFASKSDAFAIRSSISTKTDGLNAVVSHAIHSKGKILLESYVSVVDGDKYVYSIHGMCLVSVAKKRSEEILKMISSFRRTVNKGDNNVESGPRD